MDDTAAIHHGFTLTRALDAPPERVFAAWTDPGQLQWFSNDAYPATAAILDLRVGGIWRQLMIINDDTQYPTGGVYLQIAAPGKLVFRWGAYDGWPRIEQDSVEDGPVVTVLLAGSGGGTEMTFTVGMPEILSAEQADEWDAGAMRAGWEQTLDRLAASVAGNVDGTAEGGIALDVAPGVNGSGGSA